MTARNSAMQWPITSLRMLSCPFTGVNQGIDGVQRLNEAEGCYVLVESSARPSASSKAACSTNHDFTNQIQDFRGVRLFGPGRFGSFLMACVLGQRSFSPDPA